VCNFERAPNHHADQERDDDKAQANKPALPPIQAMDNFRPATGADARAGVWQCGHTSVFTSAQYHRPYQSTSKFRELFCFLDSNLGDHAGISSFQFLIPRRHDPYPLHGKVLQRQKQSAEIATAKFHVV
jgi:hypothetical protein